jgi:hypothetical protein
MAFSRHIDDESKVPLRSTDKNKIGSLLVKKETRKQEIKFGIFKKNDDRIKNALCQNTRMIILCTTTTFKKQTEYKKINALVNI